MKYLTIDDIKAHVRIDFDCEDAVLELYGESAEEAMAQILGRGKTAEEMVADLTEVYGRVPAPIIHATLMLAASAYKDRETQIMGNIYHENPTFEFLLKPYMKL